MTPAFWIRGASVLAFLAVALGAFGAHGLKNRLSADMLAVFETGVRYQFYHSLGLFVVAWLMRDYRSKPVVVAGWCFLAGVCLFSGSLYALSLTGVKKLGMITPLGGLMFLIGWACLFLSPF